jgi:transposase
MTVPGIGPIISSAMVAAIGTGDVSQRAATSAPGSGWYRNKSRREIGQSSAAYQGAAIYLRALFVQAAWVVLVKLGPKQWERYGLKLDRGGDTCLRSCLTKTAKPPPMAGRKQEVLQLRE